MIRYIQPAYYALIEKKKNNKNLCNFSEQNVYRFNFDLQKHLDYIFSDIKVVIPV